jgi:hypothetical protein
MVSVEANLKTAKKILIIIVSFVPTSGAVLP